MRGAKVVSQSAGEQNGWALGPAMIVVKIQLDRGRAVHDPVLIERLRSAERQHHGSEGRRTGRGGCCRRRCRQVKNVVGGFGSPAATAGGQAYRQNDSSPTTHPHYTPPSNPSTGQPVKWNPVL